VTGLELEVVLLRFGAKLDLLQFDDRLLLLGIPRLLALLVPELA
jgi:hypothetical protein